MAERDCLPITIPDSAGLGGKPGRARPIHGAAANGAGCVGSKRGSSSDAARAGVAAALLLCVLVGMHVLGLAAPPNEGAGAALGVAGAWPARPAPRGLPGLPPAHSQASLAGAMAPAAVACAAAAAAAAEPPCQIPPEGGEGAEDLLQRAMAALPREGMLTLAAATPAAASPQHQRQQDAQQDPRRQRQAGGQRERPIGGRSGTSGSGASGAAGPYPHPFPEEAYRLYSIPEADPSPRCQRSGICDGEGARGRCGGDGLACVVGAAERQRRVREAIKWSWHGYRKHAWGSDEADVLGRGPLDWFHLGLTIVDGIDTLLVAGLEEEYREARHWIANRLRFPDDSTVQFFEVNIRILGGLLSAYYLSGGDELFLRKAEALGDRLLPAFNTSSGLPSTRVQLRRSAGERARMGLADGQTNLAEAGTLSLEFTTLGRLTGRPDFSSAGMAGWYALMGSPNISGLHCVGLSTARGECYLGRLSVGSAADSTYEYMLKQWVLSGKTQKVPLLLYQEAMVGMRRYLVRDVSTGGDPMSFVTEAAGDFGAGTVAAPDDRFEHLTCFVGGMLVLGQWHGLPSSGAPGDPDDLALASRVGRACYELYRAAPSGVAPDSVRFTLEGGGKLPPQFQGQPAQLPARPAAAEAKAEAAPEAAAREEQRPTPASAPRRPRVRHAQLGTPEDAPNGGHSNPAPADEAQQAGEAESEAGSNAPEAQPAEASESEAAGAAAPEAASENAEPAATEPAATPHPPEAQPTAQEAAPSHPEAAAAAAAAPEDVPTVPQALAAVAAAAAAAAAGDVARATGGMAAWTSGPSNPPAARRARSLLTDGDGADGAAAEGAEAGGGAPAAADAAGDSAAAAEAGGAPPPLAPPPPPPPPPASFNPLTPKDFLRPEAAETLFYLWRATGQEVYREWGWSMFRAWERWCRVDGGGYATVRDVSQVPPPLDNKMESFWLAETLKYLYLLFEDDPSVLSFDEWVFNTEAHPLPVWGSRADAAALAALAARRAEAARLAALAEEERALAGAVAEAVARGAARGAQGVARRRREGGEGPEVVSV
ncbi:endoplasmic reticulum mannosyl-oligosaccharide 1,2-alpha-mannosidase [Raphidocelis subcapitata]|uniref:alpha-1,2-Mannosidase n=1 Tax=Raphidocelis subcapitata TaxID=307507 RepID=A0A2V0NTE7_9CHLO|nr:endoplasmic reticulum mannosyl-oligosaccharide 1,2-alpha-mannosidase [Raphidocelis subcapitata]|eukprot:GBF88105.1 endoplasmic reticulum mannosyl-oligosaccharide 1,2-alpha-mannosidase [Raphidocelis subcapitata]